MACCFRKAVIGIAPRRRTVTARRDPEAGERNERIGTRIQVVRPRRASSSCGEPARQDEQQSRNEEKALHG